METTLYVCVTCRAGEPPGEDAARPGERLAAALAALPPAAGVRIVPVECLSACSTGCAVALSGPGRWTYVYGRLGEADAPAVLDGAARHAASADGLVPWRERPEIFRRNSIARIPPPETAAP